MKARLPKGMGGGNMQQLARQDQKLQQQMTKKQEEEYNKMISQIIAFCEKHALPFFAMLGTHNKKNGDWGICHSSMLPSVRTTPIFDAIDEVVHHFMGRDDD